MLGPGQMTRDELLAAREKVARQIERLKYRGYPQRVWQCHRSAYWQRTRSLAFPDTPAPEHRILLLFREQLHR